MTLTQTAVILAAMWRASSSLLKITLFILLISIPLPVLAAPLIGDPAPILDLPTVDITSAEARLGPRLKVGAGNGKVYVIDFFATWCASCVKATAALFQVLPPLGDRVQLLIVAVSQNPKLVQQHFAENPPPAGAQIVLDSDGETARRFGQDRFPTTFLIDDKGVIAHINRGYGPGYAARIDRWLRSMLKLPPRQATVPTQ